MYGEPVGNNSAAVSSRGSLSRDFLKLGSAGLAGAALLGVAGRGVRLKIADLEVAPRDITADWEYPLRAARGLESAGDEGKGRFSPQF
jgi:hypothetical protein